MVQECVVGNLEQPGMELTLIVISAHGKISLDKCLLRQIVSFSGISTAQGKQKASEGILLVPYMCYELLAVHLFLACR